MDPFTILTALLPLVVDGGKALISKATGNKPPIASADDYIKIQEAEIKKLEVLAKLDAPTGETYKWVNAVRSMQRPVVVGIVLTAWVYLVCTNGTQVELVSNLASAVFFYLFGERTNMYLKRK